MSQLRLSADTQPVHLDEVETRVLGCLMEKAVLTPRHYPLTMNGLRNACNQRTARNPVVSWHEHILHGALERLARRGLVRELSGGRARKVEHCVDTLLGVQADGIAVLSALMLNGPLNSRQLLACGRRLYPFDTESQLHTSLTALLRRAPTPLVAELPGQDSESEPRFRHCLGHFEPAAERTDKPEATAGARADAHVQRLDEEIQWMQGELKSIQEMLKTDTECS